jgi:hypothetical protein
MEAQGEVLLRDVVERARNGEIELGIEREQDTGDSGNAERNHEAGAAHAASIRTGSIMSSV